MPPQSETRKRHSIRQNHIVDRDVVGADDPSIMNNARCLEVVIVSDEKQKIVGRTGILKRHAREPFPFFREGIAISITADIEAEPCELIRLKQINEVHSAYRTHVLWQRVGLE